jgi:purine nucleosidase
LIQKVPAALPQSSAVRAYPLTYNLVKKTCKLLAIGWLWLLLGTSLVQAQRYRVILDTDIDSDVDDVQALAMLHTLADQRSIDLLGVIVTSDDPYAPLCTDAINGYFGRPELPVGFLKNQPELRNHSRYTRQISEEFPHRLGTYQQATEAAELYRKLLSESPDSSVVLVSVGHLTSLMQLLQSPGDQYSPLGGKELVEKKVVRWLCMGGMFPAGKEANFYRPDPASTVYCLRHFPRPVTFAGWEVGNVIKTGGAYLQARLNARSPVYRAYQLYNNFQGRASWDQVAVLLLMPEAIRYLDTVTGGYCDVSEDGSNQWRPGPVGLHGYVRLKAGADPADMARLMDDMSIR